MAGNILIEEIAEVEEIVADVENDIPPFCFKITTKDSEYLMCAEREEERQSWMKAINAAVCALGVQNKREVVHKDPSLSEADFSFLPPNHPENVTSIPEGTVRAELPNGRSVTEPSPHSLQSSLDPPHRRSFSSMPPSKSDQIPTTKLKPLELSLILQPNKCLGNFELGMSLGEILQLIQTHSNWTPNSEINFNEAVTISLSFVFLKSVKTLLRIL